MATRPTPPGRSAPTCANAGSSRSSHNRQTRSATDNAAAHAAADHPAFDAVDYRERNVIERRFAHLKQWRGLATRYDKLATVYRAAAVLNAVIAWTRHLSDVL